MANQIMMDNTHPQRARVCHPWSKPYTSQHDGGMLKSASGVREECLHRHTPRQEVRLSLRHRQPDNAVFYAENRIGLSKLCPNLFYALKTCQITVPSWIIRIPLCTITLKLHWCCSSVASTYDVTLSLNINCVQRSSSMVFSYVTLSCYHQEA